MTAPSPKLTMYAYLAAVDVHKLDAFEVLTEWAGIPEKVVLRKAEAASRKGYTDYGTTPRRSWLTPKGHDTMRRWMQEKTG